MALHHPGDFSLEPTFCHICNEEVRQDHYGIEHSGHGIMTQSKDPRFKPIHDFVDGYTTVWFHPECATVMAMRLIHDVMNVDSMEGQPMRVVQALQALSQANQLR